MLPSIEPSHPALSSSFQDFCARSLRRGGSDPVRRLSAERGHLSSVTPPPRPPEQTNLSDPGNENHCQAITLGHVFSPFSPLGTLRTRFRPMDDG